jgi:hypothetical protein
MAVLFRVVSEKLGDKSMSGVQRGEALFRVEVDCEEQGITVTHVYV